MRYLLTIMLLFISSMSCPSFKSEPSNEQNTNLVVKTLVGGTYGAPKGRVSPQAKPTPVPPRDCETEPPPPKRKSPQAPSDCETEPPPKQKSPQARSLRLINGISISAIAT